MTLIALWIKDMEMDIGAVDQRYLEKFWMPIHVGKEQCVDVERFGVVIERDNP